jgi:uncharacterized protein with HEPN domain
LTSPDRKYLGHILESARRALSYVEGVTLDEFLATPLRQDAVLHRLSVMGEAAKWVSEDARNEMTDIDWRRMIGMRNFVVHEYWSTDLNLTWDTVQTKLPPLVARLEAHLT